MGFTFELNCFVGMTKFLKYQTIESDFYYNLDLIEDQNILDCGTNVAITNYAKNQPRGILFTWRYNSFANDKKVIEYEVKLFYVLMTDLATLTPLDIEEQTFQSHKDFKPLIKSMMLQAGLDFQMPIYQPLEGAYVETLLQLLSKV